MSPVRGAAPPRRAFWLAASVTVAVTAVLFWSTFRPGFLLYRDFVMVPEPVFGDATFGGSGAPRAVPYDLVTTALAQVMPAWLVQRLVLLAPLLLAGSGVAWLVRRYGTAASVTGAVLAVLNPYVAERLLLGQPPTLLAYGAVPWLVAAVRAQPLRPVRRAALVTLAALPACLTPVGGVMAVLTVALTALLAARPGSRTARGRARGPTTVRCVGLLPVLLPPLVLCLPWVVAGLRAPTMGAVRSGAVAFAAAADSPMGVVGSVLTLGGIWAPGAQPSSRQSLIVWGAEAVLLLVATASWVVVRRHPSGRRPVDLAAAAYAGSVVLVLLLAGPLLGVFSYLQQVPGVALLRDTHRLLGFGALGLAVLVARGAAELVGWVHRRDSAASVAAVAVGVVTAVSATAVLGVPDLAARLHGDLRPVSYPQEWATVVSTVAADPLSSVLVLPWQPLRETAWAGRTAFLDPMPRALQQRVLSARDLLVARAELTVRVGGEDPAQAAAWARGEVDGAALDALGVGWLVEWVGSPGVLPTSHARMTEAFAGTHFRVWRVTPG